MTEMQIRVEGLAEFARAINKVDRESAKQLRVNMNEAADLLISRTRTKVPSVSGAARASMKARSTRTSARISVGGRKAPYFPWLDFGGQGKIPGRPAARAFYTEGRYVYPTLSEIRPEIERALDEGIRDVAKNVGLGVD